MRLLQEVFDGLSDLMVDHPTLQKKEEQALFLRGAAAALNNLASLNFPDDDEAHGFDISDNDVLKRWTLDGFEITVLDNPLEINILDGMTTGSTDQATEIAMAILAAVNFAEKKKAKEAPDQEATDA